jgi:hypothetical protein
VVGNADGNGELFLYDRDADHFTQITDTIGMSSGAYAPSISAQLVALALAALCQRWMERLKRRLGTGRS